MRTNFKSSLRKTAFFAFLIVTSTTLYNCSNDDDNPGPDPITRDDVENKFNQGVDELPELDDPDITFEEPDFSAEVSTPEATTAILADIDGATSMDDLTEETKQVLNKLEAAAPSLPPAAITKANELTEADIEAILDLDQDLTDIDAAAILAALPDDIKALLPQVTFDFTTSAATAAVSGKDEITVLNAAVQLDPVAQAVDAPCEDLYRDVYDEIIATRTATRDAQLETISSNLTRRLDEAETRFNTRTETLNTSEEEFAAEIEAIADQFLAAAQEEGLEVAEEELRLMAFLVALQGRVQLQTWSEAAEEVIAEARTTEEAAVEAQAEEKEATVNANYQISKEQADAILAAGVANCHNQGAGN